MTEKDLIRSLTANLHTDDTVMLGAGDDCAVLKFGNQELLFKTDAVVEGIHFDSNAAPDKVGHKALARALSDIAAMGGSPCHCLITLGTNPEIKSGSKIIKSIDVSFRDIDAKTTSSGELYNFALESSTNFSPQFLKLESNTEGQPGTFLLENSASGLSAGNIISNVNVTEFGGEGVDQMGRDDVQTTVTITPFNPYADYNEDTGQFTQ